MKLKLAFAALAAGATIFSAPVLAQDSPVVGTWNTEAVTDFGTFAAEMTVSERADGYAIQFVDAPMEGAPADAPSMESTISDIVINGSDFSFKRSLTTPQGPMDLNYTGSVEGDTLTATVGSQMGEMSVTGTRAQ